MKVGILAGEASGDLLGAKLIATLKSYHPNLQVEGIGGPAMIAAGCQSFFDMERLSVMGLIEPLQRLPELLNIRKKLYKHFSANPPDVFIGIDAPDFNLGLEAKLKTHGIPIVHYVSPSVWAWRSYRIRKIASSIDLMLTLFPFEAKFYEDHHIPVCYVGHPMAEEIDLIPDKMAARRKLGIDENAFYIALLPGSRRQELRYMTKIFLDAATLSIQLESELKFLTNHINKKCCQEFLDIKQRCNPELPISVHIGKSQDVIAAADLVVATAGTVTLEAMFYKKAMIIAYRMSKWIFPLIKYMVKTPYIGLPNLLANEKIVPELIQEKLSPQVLSYHILDFFKHPEKINILQNRFAEMHKVLRMGSSHQAAQAIMKLVESGHRLRGK